MAVAAVALLFAASSCRLSPTSPTHDPTVGGTGDRGLALAASGQHAVPLPGDKEEAAPTITQLRVEVKHGTLYLTGQLMVRGDRSGLEYAPDRPGGWCLQVFLDTDQSRTGYWRGYEYVVRGTEWDPASLATVVRRITLEPDYPGGWGPSSGEAKLRASRGSFAIAVPLAAVGDDDGNLDFAVETYATVACPQCASGCSQVYAADYFGRCSIDGHPTPASGPVVLSDRPGRWGLRPHTGTSAPGR
jgi:hypothetical protein